ncbi:estradiol 17-beta-dehydrogenase 12-B [Elysia marginata]|uniref:Estradiol 17-beta-dehydrogenase 12-B n=1 Tax=Elysia marginata TaxID=1093978 RepID=A0AAV4J024_9GAST|nr:estradiol 17-beta-dehydrogenase 12-B [Elysia marginata]
MFQEYLAGSADLFSAIGILAFGCVAFKITMGLFRFISVHFLSRPLGLTANLQKAGSWAEEKYKVKTVVIEANFSQLDIYDNIRSTLEKLDIGVLVNNVGMSYDYPEYYAEVEDPNSLPNCFSPPLSAGDRTTDLPSSKRVSYR